MQNYPPSFQFSDDATVFFQEETKLVAQGLRCRELYTALAINPRIPRRYSDFAVSKILKIEVRNLKRHAAKTGLAPLSGGGVECYTAEAICDHLISLCEARP